MVKGLSDSESFKCNSVQLSSRWKIATEIPSCKDFVCD
jgi:hypothetical protein